MKKIFVRSPYFINVNVTGANTGSKIELFIWNKGTTEPTTPTKTLVKSRASQSVTNTTYNISNYCKEYIKPLSADSVAVPTEEDTNTWCYCKVKRYTYNGTTYTLLTTETFVCLNGYTSYSDGYNNYTNNDVVPLLNTNIKNYKYNTIPYVNVFYKADQYDITGIAGFPTLNVPSDSVYKIPLVSNIVSDTFFEYKSEQLCEPKYTPVTCTFINRYGGWQYLTFFKANMQSIEVTSKEFSMLPSDVNYNVLKGQKRNFNFQGKQKITCNTGWVDENYFELIQDLLLSEVVLLDNKPAIVKSQSAEYKTHLKDKNINYAIDFEFNYGLINDVI